MLYTYATLLAGASRRLRLAASEGGWGKAGCGLEGSAEIRRRRKASLESDLGLCQVAERQQVLGLVDALAVDVLHGRTADGLAEQSGKSAGRKRADFRQLVQTQGRGVVFFQEMK